ncbi:MAG: D-alanyl-D-alanine carboxypeptidase [Ruminococcaceae bacterium]|nr:D-alanyl-D-alanine carboxypeptidase [Oscillospiraceae bacterium]
MIKRITALFLCFIVCSMALCSCQRADIENFVVFGSIVQDINPNAPEEIQTALEMPPVVTSLVADKTDVTLVTGHNINIDVKITPEEAWNKELKFESTNADVATVDESGKVVAVGAGSCTVKVSSDEMPDVFVEITVRVKAPVVVKAPEPAPSEPSDNTDNSDEVKEETPVGLTYIGGILIANKTYALPADYNPGVDGTAYAALMQMFEAAKAEGVGYWIASGFRSYDRQNRIYNNYVAQDGKAAADRYSARPGHSEHQTGLAFDLNYLTQAFGQSREGLWLAENCHKYGFIIRYPEGKEHITGYMYEPWHVRYIGVDMATAVYESGLCLEEYLGITSVYAEN